MVNMTHVSVFVRLSDRFVANGLTVPVNLKWKDKITGFSMRAQRFNVNGGSNVPIWGESPPLCSR